MSRDTAPTVSVVIPSYRRPSETIRAARSAARQTGVSLEVIVVDDGSPEPLRLPDFPNGSRAVRLLRLPRNLGPAAARNAGVEAAAGDFVAFLDSDDFFLPGTLAPRVAFLRSHAADRPLMAVSAVWRWRPGQEATRSVPVPSSDLAELASGCWYFPGSTAIFSRETWKAVGPLDSSLRRLEDLDWGIRLAQAGGAIVVAPETGAIIQRGGPARSEVVHEAARIIEARYSPGGARALPVRALRRLRAYLALERAYSRLGERAYASFGAELLRSVAIRPRLSVHQGDWWRERRADPGELARIEGWASELAQL